MKLNKIFILHYTRVPERRELMKHNLSDFEADIDIEYITGYDAEDLTDADLIKYYNKDISEYNRKIVVYDGHLGNGVPPISEVNRNGISCNIKHLIAMDKIANGEDEFAVILEDDAIPYDSDFIKNINETINEIELDKWGCIFLGNGLGNNFIGKIAKKRVTDTLYKVGHPSTNCTEGYLLKKATAKKLLKSMIPFQQIIDWELSCALYENDVNVYWRLPSLVYQGSITGKFKSTIR